MVVAVVLGVLRLRHRLVVVGLGCPVWAVMHPARRQARLELMAELLEAQQLVEPLKLIWVAALALVHRQQELVAQLMLAAHPLWAEAAALLDQGKQRCLYTILEQRAANLALRHLILPQAAQPVAL
jgi:hypothetical protein